MHIYIYIYACIQYIIRAIFWSRENCSPAISGQMGGNLQHFQSRPCLAHGASTSALWIAMTSHEIPWNPMKAPQEPNSTSSSYIILGILWCKKCQQLLGIFLLSNVSVMSKGVGGDVLGVFMAQWPSQWPSQGPLKNAHAPVYSENWPTNLISIESCPQVTYFIEIIPRRMFIMCSNVNFTFIVSNCINILEMK